MQQTHLTTDKNELNHITPKHLPTTANEQSASPLAILRLRNFRLLWIGEAISLIGDQFYMIALPWLVLQLTGDALAVGTVLAIAGIPRALFMLVGGAYTDRFSPRLIMLGSNIARMMMVALLAVTVFNGVIQLWMLYGFALFFGLADAFFFPAQSTIVPQLVDEKNLQSGNAIIQGTAQLSLFLGPVLAGTLIAFFSKGQGAGAETAVPGLTGLAFAFAIDALTFLASALTLWFIDIRSAQTAVASDDQDENVLTAIRTALAYVWGDTILRTFFIITAAIATLINGVMAVGIPILADARLPEGAAAFGLIMSALGAGSLVGMGLAGVLPKPQTGYFGPMLLFVTGALGVGLILFAFTTTTWGAAAIALGMGVANGYVFILLITWLQMRTPPAMLGRMMSLLMFASVGLTPLSTAVAGALIQVDLTGLFIGAGVLLLFIVLPASLNTAVRAMSPNPSQASVVADYRR